MCVILFMNVPFCQHSKYVTRSLTVLLYPLFEDFSMDFFLGYPSPKVTLLFLWWWIVSPNGPIFNLLAHPFIAQKVAEVLLGDHVKLHSFLCCVVSDRDPLFTYAFWLELFHLIGM